MAALLRSLKTMVFAPPLYALLLGLGAVSLAWSLVSWVLYPLLPAQAGRDLGRASIAHVYRAFWAIASACGMMRIDASCLDALKDEPLRSRMGAAGLARVNERFTVERMVVETVSVYARVARTGHAVDIESPPVRG